MKNEQAGTACVKRFPSFLTRQNRRRRMRLFASWKRRQWETRMDEEFRFHLESRIHDYIRDGLSHSDAERRARQEFGALELARDECRDAMPLAWLDSARRSLRVAVHCLRRNPGLALTVILTLALG